ncbi:phosphate ABC transporter permease subunit PstC [Coriobacteriia bacterium Es71-Z0120]|uniref:phosphate ABC transporter permease subunit PstC n=1 Tax=Parvivirga hydrogeniphila TaxID=2939460 RepID=UPI002260F1F7|nr:phosphate ABC transporter permease subunit PstC [Parvivirga hydrogeniphila]MCL4078612.1 phosphate ABC transporter permease subunit PstC [Parvivirga hydrogeniphila]
MKDPIRSSRARSNGRTAISRAAETFATGFITASGWLALFVLAAIAAFLVFNSVKALREVGLVRILTGTDWYPTSNPGKFGSLPLIAGSILVTGVALVTSVPIGLAAAVYLSEFGGRRLKEMAKAVIEFMAAIPSVVYGLVGVALVVPGVKQAFDLDSGLTALSGGIVLGIMALPTIVSISEDALRAVPSSLRHASLALGNTRWQTTYKVTIPAASSGIFAAVMLGVGRAIGETMAVLMLTGNAAVMPKGVLESVRTMTGTIAAEMGEVVQGGTHYSVLFVVGLVLFTVAFSINLGADIVLDKQRKRWGA